MKRNYFQNFDHEKCAIYLLPVRPLTLRCAYSPHLLYHYTIFLKILMGTHFLEIFKLFFSGKLKNIMLQCVKQSFCLSNKASSSDFLLLLIFMFNFCI